MKRRILMAGIGLLVLAGLVAGAVLTHRTDLVIERVVAVPDPLLGRPHLVPARGDTNSVVMLFSGMHGWDKETASVADRLADEGVTVIGIDLTAALPLLAKADGACVDPQWRVQHLSHETQRALGLPRYMLPILAGIGAGADMAVHMANTATPAVLGSVVAVDRTPMPALPVPLCNDVPEGHGVHVTSLAGDDADAADLLVAELAARADAAEAAAGQDEIADLPVTELPGDATHGVLAIIYSGDGGWRDLDKDIGEYLAAHGVPTVGMDMLRYFWGQRTPQDSAADLSRLIRHYRKSWGIEKVVLVGYSFGADVMPALYNLLPAEDRDAVVQMSLLALSANANFEVTVGEFLASKSATTQPTEPDLKRINPRLLQCFEGKDDSETVCGKLTASGVEMVETEGGHHFDGDYAALAQHILDGLKARTGPVTATGHAP